MITIDTSGLLAVMGTQDPYHREVMQVLEADRGPYLIPLAALAEMAYMIESTYPNFVEQVFLDDLLAGRYQLACADPNLPRIKALTQKYDDLPLGLTDAAVIACAEAHGGRVLTLDRRHFSVVGRGEPRLHILPSPA